MDPELELNVEVSAIVALHAMLAERGIEVPVPNENDLRVLSIADLRRLKRELKDLSRTPISR